ncbi:hypothetical protein CLOSYM_04547 [[Clostridium] symbiosum ATCC 14940]|uniref:Uncharacterized protein n=1 Tax=[Clostridium] symbiosum ATCC 14940 TaxID=411472 RepID=A0ABC9TRC4_CLOSY|nr:hypothetical protein CLOSYM_04547 [[Clostridium] symbiosum ATCC 14940]
MKIGCRRCAFLGLTDRKKVHKTVFFRMAEKVIKAGVERV